MRSAAHGFTIPPMTRTFDEIRKLPSGTSFEGVQGTIKQVFKQRTGTGQYGPWHMQNFILRAGADEIQAVWGGSDPFSQNDIGKQITAISTETKHGLRGVTWQVRKHDGKEYAEIKITETAKVTFGGEAVPTTRGTGETRVVRDADATDTLNAVSEYATKAGNAFWITIRTTDQLCAALSKDGIDIAPEERQKIYSGIHIGMERRGLVDGLPNVPLWTGADVVQVAKEIFQAEPPALGRTSDDDGDDIPF